MSVLVRSNIQREVMSGDGDPSCHRFKVDSLADMVANYRAAGAQVLVVSGVIDPEHGQDFAGAAVEADITFCHLTVDEPTMRERLAARGWPCEAADEAVSMMKGLADAPFVTTVSARCTSTSTRSGSSARHHRTRPCRRRTSG